MLITNNDLFFIQYFDRLRKTKNEDNGTMTFKLEMEKSAMSWNGLSFKPAFFLCEEGLHLPKGHMN